MHFEQAVADDEEYDPAAHVPVTAERPVEAQSLPAGQLEVAESPVVAHNVPTSQLEHEV